MSTHKNHIKSVGEKRNRLTVVSIDKYPNNKTRLFVACDCGNKFHLVASSFFTGRTKSCGCYRREVSKINKTKHGLKKHPLYTIWCNIKGRCSSPKYKSFKDYGAKGVKMCAEWENDFTSFYEWCIRKGWVRGLEIDKDIIPQKLSIPAILYSPDMCSIVTRKTNQNNTSKNVVVTYNGLRYTLRQICDLLGIKYKRAQERILRGWDIYEALGITALNEKKFMNHSFGFVNNKNMLYQIAE